MLVGSHCRKKKETSPAGHVICVPPFGRAAGVFNPIWRSRGDKLSLEEVDICAEKKGI